MKKILVCLLSAFVLSAGLFAQSWKVADLKNEKTIASLTSKMKLKLVETKQVENGTKKLYKNGDDWLCLISFGNKKNKEDLYHFAYACIGDKAESYFTYSKNIDNSNTYLLATIKENSTTIDTIGVDYNGAVYDFPQPELVFYELFLIRMDFYYDIFSTFKDYNLQNFNYIIDRYAYFDDWIVDNQEATPYDLIEEYKAYLKDN